MTLKGLSVKVNFFPEDLRNTHQPFDRERPNLAWGAFGEGCFWRSDTTLCKWRGPSIP